MQEKTLYFINSKIVKGILRRMRWQQNAWVSLVPFQHSQSSLASDLSSNFLITSNLDHMAAGTDTVGDALCFLMYQISLPESKTIQDKLCLEFAENKHKTIDELEYLDVVVKEGLRCFPPIPMSQPRYVPKGGRTISGYYIPEGTIVSCQAYSVHRLNEDVYPDGDKFIPERWLETSRSVEMNRLFFAFGMGSRGCTGRQ